MEVYKNDPKFYTYLEQELRKRNLGNRYEQLGEQIADLRGESALHNSSGWNSKLLESSLEEINTNENLLDILDDLMNPQKAIQSEVSLTWTLYLDPFSEMQKLREEIFSIMDDYQKLPSKVKTQTPKSTAKRSNLDLQFLKETRIPGSYISEYDQSMTSVRHLQEYERSLMSLRSV